MRKYRARLEIIADILQVVSQKAKKTQIMYQANLSYKVLQRYLKNMTAYSLISFENSEQCYVLTPKGGAFLEVYKNFSKIEKTVKKCHIEVCNKKRFLEELCANE